MNTQQTTHNKNLDTTATMERPDAWITTKIKAAFAVDKHLKSFDLHVTTTDGLVTLKGHVKTQAEKQEAINCAQKIEGVQSVNAALITIQPQ